MKKPLRIILISQFLGTVTLLLAACGASKSGAPEAIAAYIQALSKQDATALSNASCADWEAQALTEMDSFTGVGSTVEDLACQQSGQEGADSYVSCSGVLRLDYNGEQQEIDLSARTYIARQEEGEWRMCGYK